MDKDDLAFDPAGWEGRGHPAPTEPELLAMQRVARELEGERDAALLQARIAQSLVQAGIDQESENALRVHELERDLEAARRQSIILVKWVAEANAKEALLERERDAAVAREVVFRGALGELITVADLRGDFTLPHPADDARLWTARMQTAWDDARAALATPSPAAEALLELAEAAETLHRELCRWLNLVDLPIEVLAAEDVVNAAVEKWQRARG